MLDKGNILLCLLLATLLLIIFYMPSPRQQPQPTTADSGAKQELKSFQANVKNFVKSMGEMEQRLQTLEDNVEHIQKQQESLHKNRQKDNIPERQPAKVNNEVVEQDTDLAAQHKREANLDNFVGEIKQDDFCFDSAEHGLDGTIELWKCHKQGRNQEFQIEEGSIRHKAWCLAVEKPEEGQNVVLKECNDNSSILKWQYHDRLLKAGNTNFCMMNKSGSGAVTLAECNAEDATQQWKLERSFE